MKRSPLNNTLPSGRPYGARHMPYSWKSNENVNDKDYQLAEGNSRQRLSVSGASSQICNDNFISLNLSTPTTQHNKYNATNRYSPASGRSSGSEWYNSYRSNRYSTNRYYPKQFYGQKRKVYKGTHRQLNVSAYVDIKSFLEDPWQDLVQKLNNSKDINERKESENESLCSSKITSNPIETPGCKLLSTNLHSSHCSLKYKKDCSIDKFEIENTSLDVIPKIHNLVELEIGNICSDQDLINESTCSIDNGTCEVITQEVMKEYPS